MNDLLKLPCSPQHEKSVLSVLINWPEKLDEAPHLTRDHFHTTPLWFDLIHSAIQRSNGQAIDTLSLLADAQALHGGIDSIGGASMLAELSSYTPSPHHFSDHVATLSEFRARRLAVRAGLDLIESATTEDAESLVAATGTPITAIGDALTDSKPPLTLKAIIQESLDRFQRRAEGTENSMGIPTIPELDERLQGLHPGRVWVIGAYPEGGKSVLASQIVLNAVLEGFPCLFLTLEMSERDLMDRMLVQAGRMDARAFTEPKIYAAENGGEGVTKGLMQAVKRAVSMLAPSPLRIQRPANKQLQTVVAAIRKAKREMGIKVAAVDYLQLIQARGAGNKEGEISEISHTIQTLAQDLEITILVLSQLNADGDTKHGRVIEEDADAVLNIVQDRNKESETYKQHRHILIAKDRHYGSGGRKVPLILNRDKIRFEEGEDTTEKKTQRPQFQR
jgi:replicative DNA helicase